MTREESLRTVNYWYVGTEREHAHLMLINKIYDDFEQQLADYKKRIEELEAPKTCQGCKDEHQRGSELSSCHFCTRGYNDYYKPKDKQ